MKKRFVVDTNVLINDPSCITKLGEGNDVIIPIGVIEELDKHKKGNSEKSRACRQAVRNIEEYRINNGAAKLREGVLLPNGGTLYVKIESPDVVASAWLDDDYTDNVTLQMCIEEMEAEAEGEVVLLTKDTALRIKGDAFGVNVQDYQESLVEDVSMYDAISDIELTQSEMSDLYSHGHLKVRASSFPEDFHVNQYAFAYCSSNDEGTPIKVHKYEGTDIIFKLVGKQSAYDLYPKNLEQRCALDALCDPSIKLVSLAGRSGTGKTLLSLAAGFEQVIQKQEYSKVLVMRPVVSVGKELGHLPGTIDEKLSPWMAPVYDSLEVLTGDTKRFKQDLNDYGWLDIQAISMIRGRSIPNTYIIVDEIQNLSLLEIKTIVTRAGKGTKIVVTGDPFQIDNPYLDEYSNGLTHLIDNMKGESIFANITLTKGERSELAEISSRRL